MKKNLPSVSLFITCYNYADFVSEAIESAINQTYQNIDVTVIDDGSTDNSLEVIREYEDRISVISRENKGIVATRNEALETAKGKYLLFLDADDYFDLDYVEKMVKVAEDSQADVVYPNWHIFGDESYTKTFQEFETQRLIEQQIHCTSESLIRLSATKGHTFESEKVAEDWDFFLGLALAGKKFKLANDCFINYRVRSNTRSSQNGYWDDMYYFVAILRKWQKRYPNEVNALDLPVYAGRSRDEHIQSLNQIIAEKDEAIIHLHGVIKEYSEAKNDLTHKIDTIEQKRLDLLNSISYKIGKMLASPVRMMYKLLRKMYRWTKKVRPHIHGLKIDLLYARQFRWMRVRKKSTVAVIIHLYYLDNWPLFKRKLQLLPKGSFDLYITLPKENSHFINTIQKDFPDVHVVKSPNRGRDVLPFMKTLKCINDNGYDTVLKFHSKKSTHREDGQEWLESMMNQIVPDDKNALKAILQVVKESNFGVLGPADVYYPLTINYPGNKDSIDVAMRTIYDVHKAGEIASRRKEYGFFGGTMLWMNVSAIRPLLRFNQARYFEEEAGQVDGTFAHALERLLCVVPEMEDKSVYQSDGHTIERRSYASGNIPEWSEDHDK